MAAVSIKTITTDEPKGYPYGLRAKLLTTSDKRNYKGLSSIGDTTVGNNPSGWIVQVWDMETGEMVGKTTIGSDGYWNLPNIIAGVTCAAIMYPPTASGEFPSVHVRVVT